MLRLAVRRGTQFSLSGGTPMVAASYPLNQQKTSPAIKLLDLLTNRYHLGVVRESSGENLQIEVPASSHFHAGQRVRYVVAGEDGVVRRHSMHRAFVTNVLAGVQNPLRIQLAI